MALPSPADVYATGGADLPIPSASSAASPPSAPLPAPPTSSAAPTTADPYGAFSSPAPAAAPPSVDPYAAFSTPVGSTTPATPGYWQQGVLQRNLGVADAALHYARGVAAPFVGGLEYLGSLALGRGTDQALADKNAIENTVTGSPMSAAGRQDVGDVNSVVAPVGQYVAGKINSASDTAAQYGGPLAGAAVKTTLQGLPYILPYARIALDPVRAAAGLATSADAAEAAASSARSATARASYSSPELTGTAADDQVGAAAAAPPTYEGAPPPSGGQPTTSGELPPAVQAKRAQTLADLGLTNVRESAVTGDPKAAATDYQTSKLDNTPGKNASAAFAQERAALDNFSDRLVTDTGGSAGLDENALHARGQTILAPLEGLDDAYTTQIRQLYGAADARAQGMPVQLSNTAAVIGNKPEFVGTVEGQQLLQGINSFLQRAGIADESGNIGGATVQQAEQLKRYLNGQWSPRTSRLIGTIKDAIDDDVTSSAGQDVYGAARALRAKRAAVLDDPKGIGSLLDASGPEGINRKVPYESVPDKILQMPVDQFNHVVGTLRNAINGPEQVEPALKVQAQQALNEIRSQAMLRLQEQAQRFKGAWNNRGVTQYLNQNSAKLARIFTPRELSRIRTLHDAGNILDVDRTYPGAAAQKANFVMRGVIQAVRHVPGYVTSVVSHGTPAADAAVDVAGGVAAKMLERRYGTVGMRMRQLKVNPKAEPVMEQVLLHPKAESWLRGKTTGSYLRMMSRLGSGAELQKAATALQQAGQQNNDPDAVEAAKTVRDAVAATQPPPGADTRNYQGFSYYLKPGANRRLRSSWVKYKKAN